MLSKQEWNKAAELAAAAKYGTQHAAWLRFKRFGAGPTAVLAAAAALGLGAWWLFAHVFAPLFSGPGPTVTGHLPVGFWIVAGVFLVGTIAAFRVRLPSAPFLLARTFVSLLVWLGMVAYAVGVLAF